MNCHSRPQYSIVIVTHNSAEDIRACLDSVGRVKIESTEVFVVDAGSSDETGSIVLKNYPNIKFVQLRNVGFAAAANTGAGMAFGEVLVFLNPDARLPANWQSLLNKSLTDPRVVAVGGLLLDASGNEEQWQNSPFPSVLNIIKSRVDAILGKKSHKLGTQFSENLSCDWVSGCLMAVKRSEFEKISGFDESFFLYFEDIDLCKRMKEREMKIVLNTGLKITHQGGKSGSLKERKAAHGESQRQYFSFHRPLWENFVFRLGLMTRKRQRVVTILIAVAFISAMTQRYYYPSFFAVFLLSVLLSSYVFRRPGATPYILFFSLLFGQSFRVSFGTIKLTVTDLLLPLIILLLSVLVVRKGKLWNLKQAIIKGWWIYIALLPGLLLAWERLPSADFFIASAYFSRLMMVLSLIPLAGTLEFPYRRIKSGVIIVATVLALIGFLQLRVLPALPPLSHTFFSALFLDFSGGGWDPHQNRLFATWLDPNFLGGLFVMALVLILAGSGRIQKKNIISSLFSLIIIFSALALTKSRTAFVALGIALILFYLVSKAKRFALPVISFLAAALIIFPSLSERIFINPVSDATVLLRINSWRQAIGYFENYWLFGIGYNSYGSEQLYSARVTDPRIHSLAGADNFILLLLATGGIWGAIFILGGLGNYLLKLYKKARQGNDEYLGVLLSLSVLVVHSQFVQSFTYIHLLTPLVLLIGSKKKE